MFSRSGLTLIYTTLCNNNNNFCLIVPGTTADPGRGLVRCLFCDRYHIRITYWVCGCVRALLPSTSKNRGRFVTRRRKTTQPSLATKSSLRSCFVLFSRCSWFTVSKSKRIPLLKYTSSQVPDATKSSLRSCFVLFSRCSVCYWCTASKNERVSLLKYTSSQVLGHCQLAQVGGNQSRRECLCDVALAVYVWGSNMK